MIPPTAVLLLRDATPSLHDPAPTFGLAQALVVIGLAVLFVMLAGVVFWRIRQTSRTRQK